MFDPKSSLRAAQLLLSSSDVQRMCANKTLDFEGKMSLGC